MIITAVVQVVLLIALVVLALAAGTVTVMLVNRNRIRFADDPMAKPYGDMPVPPDHDDPLRRSFTRSPGVALRVKGGGTGFHIPSGRCRRLLSWWRS